MGQLSTWQVLLFLKTHSQVWMHELPDTLHLILDLHHSSISATAKRSRKDIVTFLPSHTKLAGPSLGAAQHCPALLLCPQPTLSPAHSAASPLQPQPGQQTLLAPQLTAKHIQKQVPLCYHQYSMWENDTTVLQTCLTHSSTPVLNTQINSLQFTEVHVPFPG